MHLLVLCLLVVRLAAADDPVAGNEPAAVSPAARGAFSPTRDPLRPGDFPNWSQPVNRDRVYDFYAKEAIACLRGELRGDFLPAYPGLDGGRHGHWGNQNDQDTWRDGRWAASDHGNLFSGVFSGAGQTVAKAVWVREGDLNGCFDPDSLCFRVRWKGDFLRLSDYRHGFNGAAEMAGEPTAAVPARKLGAGDAYHGFYRQGERVIFRYTLAGKEYTETLGGGRRELAQNDLPRGGPSRWPARVETVGKLGAGNPFAVDTLTLPFANPYGTLFFVSGFDFLSQDTIALCTMTGEVWLVRGVDAGLGKLLWKRFATGLHQPLGLKVLNGQILVLGRDQVTRLVDLNGDDEADFHECLTNAFATSIGSHDYIVGLDADPKGRLLTASASQGILRLNSPTAVEVLGSGLRNPNGIGVSPDGRYVVSQGQEGDWTPASSLFQVDALGKRGVPYFGHPGPREGVETTPPLLYLPRGEDNSSGGAAFVPKWAWPDLSDDGSNLVHLSYGAGSAFLVTRSDHGQPWWHGAATLITGAFDAGPQHARFSRFDRHLYVSGMTGWGTYTPADGCLQRVRRTGRSPMLVRHSVLPDGIELIFSEPLDRETVEQASNHFAQAWNYRYSPAYGSAEYSVAQPGRIGHDRWRVQKASLDRSDRRRLFLELPDIRPANQVHLHVALAPGLSRDIFLTIHTRPLGGAVGGLEQHAGHVAPPPTITSSPVPWESELCGETPRRIELRAATGLQYAQRELRAVAGEYLALDFENPDDMPHNWVLTKVGAADAVARLADKMVAQPDAFGRHYVPESDDILCHSRVLLPRTRTTLYFRAPAAPGRYPYLCTFPGHAQIMRGELVVDPQPPR